MCFVLQLFCSRQVPEEIRQFDVILEEPDHVYFCGDQISGHVKVDLAGCLTVQGITVRFVGEAYVSVPEQSETSPWNVRNLSGLRRNLCSKNKISPSMSDLSSYCGTEVESPDSAVEEKGWTKVPRRRPLQPRRTREQNKHSAFCSHEKYFEHKMYVFGHKYSSKRERLWAGEHSFPFQYTLPAKLPASFHGRLGYVRYFCEATLERNTLPNIQSRTMFSVSNIADVNTDPKADSGVSEQRSTNSCLFCCQKGTIIVSACLKRRAYAPGENILISADIVNMSNTQIHRSCAKLIQFIVDIAGETNLLKLQMPLILGTVPLQREFSKLQPASAKDYKDQVPPLKPQRMETKYKKLPAVFSQPCVWGPQLVEYYYYQQVSRHQDVQSMPRAIMAPHQEDKTFVPHYICYRKVAGLARDSGFAHGIPQIVITEYPPCLRHHHLPLTSRRHSAPGHIAVPSTDKMPTSPADTSFREKLPDIPETK